MKWKIHQKTSKRSVFVIFLSSGLSKIYFNDVFSFKLISLWFEEMENLRTKSNQSLQQAKFISMMFFPSS